MPKKLKGKASQPALLKGWQQIADFLGEPASVIQRWARQGMPVRREGRFVVSSPRELDGWLGKESGKPVHSPTETTDLAAELKRGLSYLRHEKQAARKKGSAREHGG